MVPQLSTEELMQLRKTRLVLAGAMAAMTLTLATPAAAQSYLESIRYPNPTGDLNDKRGKPCADPWVTYALQIVYDANFSAGHCAITLYNGGRWSDFNQLVHAVARTRDSLKAQGLRLGSARVDGRLVPVLIEGANNIVAAGAGNLIGMDGATLIGNDAGSFMGNVVPPATFSFAPAGTRVTMSERTVPLGSGMLVIKR
jgi:hypothetical protein